MTATERPFAFDPVDLVALASRVQPEYAAARPWPHVVLHGVVPDELIARVRAEALLVQPDVMTVSSEPTQVKREFATNLGPATSELLAAMEAAPFERFLEQLTGVSGLQPDPDHAFAGVHETPPGGYTLVHRDFRKHPTTGLHHRVNVLLYCNERWEEEWGGSLEMWPADMKAVGRRVLPQGNTMVIWETHDGTLHGLPDPVAHPEGLSRIALASYWYSAEPRRDGGKRHDAVFARRPQDNWRVGRRSARVFMRDLIYRGRRSF